MIFYLLGGMNIFLTTIFSMATYFSVQAQFLNQSDLYFKMAEKHIKEGRRDSIDVVIYRPYAEYSKDSMILYRLLMSTYDLGGDDAGICVYGFRKIGNTEVEEIYQEITCAQLQKMQTICDSVFRLENPAYFDYLIKFTDNITLRFYKTQISATRPLFQIIINGDGWSISTYIHPPTVLQCINSFRKRADKNFQPAHRKGPSVNRRRR